MRGVIAQALFGARRHLNPVRTPSVSKDGVLDMRDLRRKPLCVKSRPSSPKPTRENPEQHNNGSCQILVPAGKKKTNM
jgi:hypothetical protein